MIVEVVAGIIMLDNRILVCQRNAAGAFPLKWEFPGGKVERGERKVQALKRELSEELNIAVTSARQVFEHRHAYAVDRWVDLTFFHVEAFEGTPQNRVFQHMAWVPVEELEKLDFLEGDLPLIGRIRRGRLP